jgi:2-dehydro-3-deoxyphosphogluconate aldolase/(4S)-4-hydroxy-2-oxoglutarate aldolase
VVGERYIISSNVDEAVIHETKALGLPSFLGALTPSEVARALIYAMGADVVRLFPAESLGTG